MLYATDVLYESHSEITSKKLLSVEYNAIKVAYGLPRDTKILDCLNRIEDDDMICSRIHRRRMKFIKNQHNELLITHGESLPYSEGRPFNTIRNYIPSGKGQDNRILHMHMPRLRFSEVNEDNIHLIPMHPRLTRVEVQTITGPYGNPDKQKEWRDKTEKLGKEAHPLGFAPSQSIHPLHTTTFESHLIEYNISRETFYRLHLAKFKKETHIKTNNNKKLYIFHNYTDEELVILGKEPTRP